MQAHKFWMLAAGLLAASALAGCAGAQPTPVTLAPGAVYTQVAGTVLAELTGTAAAAFLTEAAAATRTPAPSATVEIVLPPASSGTPPLAATATYIPEEPPVLAPTQPPPPTQTPEPTFTHTPPPPPSATPTPVVCDWAQYLADVSSADSSIFTPGASFIKTWRIRNIGRCVWSPEYRLVFVDGTLLGGKTSVPLPAYVFPSETIDVSIELTAPYESGRYRGYWLLRNAEGGLFGLGERAEDPFWVEITVLAPPNDYVFDFAANYCLASWRSGGGLLECAPDDSDDFTAGDGFVDLLGRPDLEIGREDEPGLWMRPNDSTSGWISGTYPPIRIRSGDHFRAWIGCLNDSPGCTVTFQLDYEVVGGGVRNLGTWWEAYDGSMTTLDLDLSGLAGESVRFILTVLAQTDRPSRVNAVWFVPRIQR